ncbi:tetratricopeptide repeat-containing sensor histidine kinase [Rubrolithibacter danxiaensis]|uniref:tetratricopeptide repeat-containing sensor histidine kinase n=1 Tax=Rubrolithibacter danxiaensis TaxID=3390805 RepID=UPI003BF8EBDF
MRFFSLLFLLIPGLVAAQQNKLTDSLKRITRTASSEEKVSAYHRLITELQQQDPQAAFRYIRELKSLSVKTSNSTGRMLSNYQLGLYYNLQGKYDSLKAYGDSCLQLAEKEKLTEADAYGNHLYGTYYWQTGMFDKAIKSHLKALKIREILKDSVGIGASLASLSGVYFSNNQLDKAEQFVKKALVIAGRINDDRLHLRCLHTLANIYGISGQYDKALATDRTALKICAKTNNLRGFSEIYSNMALCYFYTGNLDASLSYHYKVLDIDRFFKDDKQIGDTYLNLALVYRKKKDFVRAKLLLQKAIALFKKTEYKYGLKDAYLSLSDAYKETGDYQHAYLNYLAYTKVSNQISNEDNEKHIAMLNVQYETEQREQKIRNLSQQSTIQQLQLKQRTVWLMSVIGLLVAVISIAWLVYTRRKLKEKALLQEEINRQQHIKAQAVLDAEEQERQRIATELHDGVGQVMSASIMNLNMLFQKIALTEQEEALASSSLTLLSEGYDELRAISHQMVPNSLVKKGLQSAISDMLRKIDRSLLKTSFDASGVEKVLDVKIETALYRIIQEAVNNVLKHAAASKLYIQLIKDNEGISLTIEDNGKGFDTAGSAFQSGMGLKNIRSRVEFLRGTIDIESGIDRGTLLVINLPLGQKYEKAGY